MIVAGYNNFVSRILYWWRCNKHLCLFYCSIYSVLWHCWLGWTVSGTTQVSQYQKGKTRKVKPIWIYCSKRVSGSGISWAICKFAPRLRQITTTESHHSVFYRPDALPSCYMSQTADGLIAAFYARYMLVWTPKKGNPCRLWQQIFYMLYMLLLPNSALGSTNKHTDLLVAYHVGDE